MEDLSATEANSLLKKKNNIGGLLGPDKGHDMEERK